MLKYICDICKKELKKDELKYEVKIEVKATYDTLEINLLDLLKNHKEEIQKLVEELRGADPQKLQDDIYKTFNFHICYPCQQKYIKDPLGEKKNEPFRKFEGRDRLPGHDKD